MSRSIWTLFARTSLYLFASLTCANQALAQQVGSYGNAAVAFDRFGTPIALVNTPVLEVGAYYEIQTYDLRAYDPFCRFRPELESPCIPDTVMSVRSSNLVDADTIAGADSCATPGSLGEIEPSCVRLRFDGTTSGTVWLWIRAFRSWNAGTTRIRLQQVPSATAVPVDVACTDNALIPGCWIDLTGGRQQYGGFIRDGMDELGPDLQGPVQFETTEAPGSAFGLRTTAHMILFAGENSNPDENWKLKSNGAIGADSVLPGGPFSHRSGVEATAQWSGIGADIGLHNEANRNTVIATPLPGLGAPFRFLRNDRVQPRPNSTLTAPVGTDWDQDGLGTELERILRLCDSRSSPAPDDFLCSAHPQCLTRDEEACQAALRDSDGDGMQDDVELYGVTSGGRMHNMARWGADPARFDVFVEMDHLGKMVDGECQPVEGAYLTAVELKNQARIYARLPGFRNRDGSMGIAMHFDTGPRPRQPWISDTRWGDWGGARSPVCEPNEIYGRAMTPSRRWLFRWLLRFDRAAGGGSTNGPLSAGAGGIFAVAHELGHQPGLAHAGLNHRVGAVNGNPFYWSRMNYLFGDYGDPALDPDSAGPDFVNDRVSFSDGRFSHIEVNLRRLDEACPFGPTVRTGGLLGATYAVGRNAEVEDCDAVDWNGDGEFAPDGTYVGAKLLRSNLARMHQAGDQVHTRGGGDISIAGDQLVWSLIRDDGAGRRFAEVHIETDTDCAVCPAPAGAQYPPCWTPDGDVVATLRQRSGIPFNDVSAVATEGVRLSTGEWVTVAVFVNGGVLHHGYFRSNGEFQYAGSVPESGGLLAAAPDEHQPALARAGTSQQLLLVYRDRSTGEIVTHRGIAGSDRVRWTPRTLATSAAGISYTLRPNTSPELTNSFGDLGDGVILATARDDDTIGFAFLAPGASDWNDLPALTLDVSDTGIRGQPSLVQSVYGAEERLTLTWLATSDTLISVPQVADSLLGTGRWTAQRFHRGLRAPFAPLLAFDRRGENGVRGVYAQWNSCETDRDCSGVADRCTTLVPAACEEGGDIESGCPIRPAQNYCTSEDRFTTGGKEFLLPYADGFFAGRLYDVDDTAQLRHGFCRTLRDCRFDGAFCRPPEWTDLDASGSRLSGYDLCSPEPSIDPLMCTP